MDFWTAISGIVAALVGGGAITHVGRVWLDNRKQAAREKLDGAEQPVEQLTEINRELRNRIESLEKAHQRCMDDHITTQRQIGRLEGMIEEQRAGMHHLREANKSQASQIIKTAAEVAVKASDSGLKLPAVDNDHPLPVVVVEPK